MRTVQVPAGGSLDVAGPIYAFRTRVVPAGSTWQPDLGIVIPLALTKEVAEDGKPWREIVFAAGSAGALQLDCAMSAAEAEVLGNAPNASSLVSGVDAVGSAPTVNPIPIAGLTGGNVKTLLVDSSGRPITVGPDATGAASTTNPNQVAGIDTGGLVRPILVDGFGGVLPGEPEQLADINTLAGSAAVDTGIIDFKGHSFLLLLITIAANSSGTLQYWMARDDGSTFEIGTWGSLGSTSQLNYLVFMGANGTAGIAWTTTGALSNNLASGLPIPRRGQFKFAANVAARLTVIGGR